MVTFSIPGDESTDTGTSKARPPLPFAKRPTNVSSYSGGFTRGVGTPQTASTRKILSSKRNDDSENGLSSSSIATARNLFRTSILSDAPPSASIFSPDLSRNSIRKVLPPVATPEPSRVFRQSTVQATPRGLATKVTDKELFHLRISSPPPELTGEALSSKVPKDWKGSIYAEQFLAHLCPPQFDEEQRRQFFAILDLRRLKYAANEIFTAKDWKLNVTNFAKEFEKSRSLILLRYGLYEFQNIKPSKEVLKRWRREHGLPDHEDEETENTPSKASFAKKRKATDDLSQASVEVNNPTVKEKRRAIDRDYDEDPQDLIAPTPAPSVNKRKASENTEHPFKMLKSTPSSSKALFEKIANKSSSIAQSSQPSTVVKTKFLASNKPAEKSLVRFVLTNTVSQNSRGALAGNHIFKPLSEASSGKYGGIESDVEAESMESETGSDDINGGAEQSNVASIENGTQIDSNIQDNKAASLSGGSVPSTRESTPGRSLFDRITKGSDGQPVRADNKSNISQDQTWDPKTTPIKFAPTVAATQSSEPPSHAPPISSGPTSAPKNTTSSTKFGAKEHDASAEVQSADTGADGGKDGGESDKENESQHRRKSPFETKQASAEVPKLSSDLTESTTKVGSKPETSSAAMNLFGSLNKTSVTSSSTPPTLFGANPAGSTKSAESDDMKTSSIFSTPGTSKPFAPTSFGSTVTASSVFGTNKPNTAPTGLFGATIPAKPSASFGVLASQDGGSFSGGKVNDAASKSQASSQPLFSMADASGAGKRPLDSEADAASSKPLFGAPKPSSSKAAETSLFDGSPMKQDEQSPAKKIFVGGDGDSTGSSTSIFNFGAAQPATSGTPNTNGFGVASTPATAPSGSGDPLFGAGSSNPGAGTFNFNFSSGGTSGPAFNNPFAKNSSSEEGTGFGVTTGSLFNFGGATSSTGVSATPFQFGSASGATGTALSSNLFGGAKVTSATPSFGASSATGDAPAFSFSGAVDPQTLGGGFGSNQSASEPGGLQPRAGGSSTTGTNSPLNFGGGGSSLATTPAAGTPEPSTQADGTTGMDDSEGEKHAQINLTDGAEKHEEVLFEVRAKALKFVPSSDRSSGDDKAKSKSPWSTQGVGPLRLLKHEETGIVRLLLRSEPRGNVVMNRAVLPHMVYKSDEKYVKMTTSNEEGDGLETWMIQVKTKDSAHELAEALEKSKVQPT